MPKKITITVTKPGEAPFSVTREKPEHGVDYTDRRFRELSMRLRAIYQQAADDLYAKQMDFLEGHRKRAEKYWQMVQAGELSMQDYQAWMRGQVYQSEQWAYKRGQLARLMADLDAQVMRLINEGRMDVFAENANWAAYKIEQVTGMIATFGLMNVEAVERLIRDNPNILPTQDIDETKNYRWYNEIIQNAVIHGILQGETLDEIARRLSEETGEKALNVLRRNARTGFTGAMNAGSLLAMKRARDEFGIRLQKRWMATLDDKTRTSHARLDGQVQDIDQPFDSLLGPIMCPGDPDAEPANVWNCRCYMDEFFPEYDNTRYRYDAEGNFVGDISYEEWQRMKMDEDEE